MIPNKMLAYENAINFLESTEVKFKEIIIVEERTKKGKDKEVERKVVFSKGDWDIKDELDVLFSAWNTSDSRDLTLARVNYSIIRNTKEFLIACKFKKKKEHTIREKCIVSYREDDHAIIVRLGPLSKINLALAEIPRALRMLSEKKPYLEPEIKLGKDFDKLMAPGKILFNTTQILQKMGLQKFGLSFDEAQVYLSLLKRGEKGEKVGNLNKELEIKRPTIYAILDRLEERDWVKSRSPSDLEPLKRKRQKASLFFAEPLMERLEKTIQDKEAELRILKGFKLIIKDRVENGWRGDINYENLGITGINKDCGLVLFEFDRTIEKESDIIKMVLDLFNLKIKSRLIPDMEKEKEIEIDHPKLMDLSDYTQYTKLKDTKDFARDIRDLALDYTNFKSYQGSILSIRFKKNSKAFNNVGGDWIILLKNVAVPIQDKIYLIWGSEEKFSTLLDIILGLK